MPTNTEKYKKLFIIEAEEKIAALNTALLGLEKEPESITLANEAMRAAHTLKSSSAAMNFMEMSHLTHAMEDMFEEVRTKKHSISAPAIETLFAAVDTLSLAISKVKKGEDEPSTLELVKKLGQMKSATAVSGVPPEGGKILNLKSENIAPIESIKVDVATLDKLMSLTEELLVEGMRLGEILRGAREASPQQLTSDNSQLTKGSNVKGQMSGVALSELESSSEVFNRLISELQLHVTRSRMVPLGQIFERFPRMVRDLAHDQGKEVDFQIEGQDIEIDRTIIDRLGEPLIHLLRNAVDHGIEKEGKIHLTAISERDKVIIEVVNEGRPIDWQKVTEVALTRGIISKEKRNEFAASLPTTNYKLQPELADLLYRVSTKEKVTEISGRGVGLAIVKSVIESLGGKVTFESNVNSQMSNVGGTKFILSLPLTLAIIQALLVRAAGQTFALPFVHIDRSVRVSRQNIKKAFDQEVAVVDGEDIPMMRLEKLFGIEKKQTGLFLSEEEIAKKISQRDAELMVIIKRENLSMVGIMIDELISEQSIVVKPFKGMLKQAKGFAGITLLGDGKPAMILDVATLI